MKYTILYEEYGLRVNIFTCYSWEIALSIGLDLSFDNMTDWKGMRRQRAGGGGVNSAKTYIIT
jgi:hypothetical protein